MSAHLMYSHFRKRHPTPIFKATAVKRSTRRALFNEKVTHCSMRSRVKGNRTLSATLLPLVARNASLMPCNSVRMAGEDSTIDVSILSCLRKNRALCN